MKGYSCRILLCISLAVFLSRAADAQTVKGKFYFNITNARKGPAKYLKVILVPYNSTNESITGNLFFYGDDAEQLRKMGAQVTSTNNDGAYFFSNVKPGSYIIKVCERYGISYKCNATRFDNGVLNIADLNAVFN